MIHTVYILWHHYLGEKKKDALWDTNLKAYKFEINFEQLVNDMQVFFGQPSSGEREQSFPHAKWIRKALEFLEKIGYCKKKDKSIYFIYWKDLRGDILERFIKDYLNLKSKSKKSDHGTQYKQPDFFDSQ